jgi:signal transduction histidine kinase
VRVTPALWDASWFRVALGGAAFALVVAVLWRRDAVARRWRAAQEAFSRELIESQERERRRIAGELHDGLGQDLLVVKNRALIALKGDGLHAPAREQLQHIDEIATRTIEVVRGLAHHLTPYQLDHLGLAAALQSMITAVADASDVAFDVRVEPVDRLLPVELEINLYRIVQEAVSNVVRHAQANRATVHVRREADTIVATIRDDGRGFELPRDDSGRLALGFGLSGMTERARILSGRIDVLSVPGRGTTIEVFAPVRLASIAVP